jgi:hypothetical protein
MKKTEGPKSRATVPLRQGCGSRSASGSGLDPDSMTLWIRIGDPDPGSGSRGTKIKKTKYLFSCAIFYLIRTGLTPNGAIFLTLVIPNGYKIKLQKTCNIHLKKYLNH